MKRLLSLITAMAAIFGLSAQNGSVPVNEYMESGQVTHTPILTPVVGVGGSSLLESNDDGQGTSGGFAIKAGVDVEIPVTASWSFQTGLSFQSLMGHSNSIVRPTAAPGLGVETYEESIHQCFLHLPAMAGLRLQLSSNLHLLLRFGGFVACGVGGKTTISRGNALDEKYGTFSGNAFDRFDAGPEWGVSLEYQRFTVGYNGYIGLVDRSSYLSANNFVNFLTIGYRL